MQYYISTEIQNKINELDNISYRHSYRVYNLCQQYEDLVNAKHNLLSASGLVHDIGKLYIDTKILDKRGCLTTIERRIVNLHPYIGYEMLKECNVEEDICRMVLYHHGPKAPTLHSLDEYENDEVMKSAMTLCTIDSFEALTAYRPYREGYSIHKAIQILDKEGFHEEKVLRFLLNQRKIFSTI